MYTSRNSILLIVLTISIIFLWCKVQPSYADTNEQEQHVGENIEDDNNDSDELIDLFERASLRPVSLQQRASLRPFVGKRASLRPFVGKRASLRPFTGKRASLRPANHMGKRKRRSVMIDNEY
ncbi:unnamed protein product [Adineta steineri]|uniref:Uncharacterized protein n=1 Tax=Adineta steineri TaxID=433720 RepID=A0A819MYN3_9BILA|nr:unnamed protein product [Adineta steineri]CAF3987273.1 unnamed protein product [Adineta steineri]